MNCLNTQNQLSQLFFAIDERRDDRIEQILKNGFDVNHVIRSSNNNSAAVGWTALHHACDCRNESAVKILLEFDADFTVKDQTGCTALHLCVNDRKKDNDAIVKLILDAHVKRNVRANPVDNFNLSHFHIACVSKHAKAISFFKTFCQLDDVVYEGSPILPDFSLRSELTLDEVLNKIRARPTFQEDLRQRISQKRKRAQEIDSRDDETKKPRIVDDCEEWSDEDSSLTPVDELMRLCWNGTPEQVESILESGTVDLSGEGIAEKALYLACHAEKIDNVKLLIDHGADFFATFMGCQIPDLCTKMFGWRVLELLPLIDPLDDSCTHEKRAREFCLAVLNPANKDFLNYTFFDKSNLGEFINKSCMSSNSRIWRGATPVQLILKFSYDTERLRDHEGGANVNNEVGHPSIQVFQRLSQIGANFLKQDSNGTTPLHRAFYSGNLQIVREILKQCTSTLCPVNVVDDNGLSPFHIFCILDSNSAHLLLSSDTINLNTKLTREIKVTTNNSVIKIPSGSTPLHSVISNGAWSRALLLIYRNIDVSVEDVNGLMPIDYAIMHYKDDTDSICMKPFLEQLLSRSKSDFTSTTATLPRLQARLQAASATDKVDEIKDLVQLGADVNSTLLWEMKELNVNKSVFTSGTPSHVAYHFGRERTLEVLVKHGADLNLPNADGLTCLHLALANWLEGCPRQKVKKVVDLMRFNWRNPARIDHVGMTKLHVACALGIVRAVELLIQSGSQVNRAISRTSSFLPGVTPLLATVMFSKFKSKEQYLTIMKILLRNGANPMSKTPHNETAIHLAFRLRKTEMVHLMLTENREIGRNNVKNDIGLSLLQIASAFGSEEVVTRFLKHEVDVDEPVNILSRGWSKSAYDQSFKHSFKTPLHFAINTDNKYHEAIVKTLLSGGANPNKQDSRGKTPLHYACEADSANLVKILLGAENIDLNLIDAYGNTALCIALKCPILNNEVISILLSSGASMYPNAFQCAIDRRDLKILSFIVDKSKSIPKTDETGTNFIHKLTKSTATRGCFMYSSPSLSNEFSNLIWALSKRGVDIDGKDSEGQTPLHLAVEHNFEEAVEALLNNGADLDAINRDGITAFQISVNMSIKSPGIHARILRILIKHLKTFDRVGKMIQQLNHWAEIKRSTEPSYITLLQYLNGKEEVIDPVEKVKMETIMLTKNFSLYDMLSARECKVEKVVKNKKLIKVLRRQELWQEFPMLGGILKFQYRIACKRRELNESAGLGLSQITGINLMGPCMETIAKYLGHKDLENLAKISK